MLFKQNRWSSVAVMVSVGAVAGCGAADTGTPGSDEEVAEQTQGVVPAIPTQVSPNGVITTATPAYVWNPVDGATGYVLFVREDGPPYVNKIPDTPVTAATACVPGGQCSITPATEIAVGGAAWWVRATNADGAGPWSLPSSGMKFRVSSGATEKPGEVAITAPANGATVGFSPTFSWNAIVGAGAAEKYEIHMDDAASGAKIQEFTAAASCTAGTCSATLSPPRIPLVIGSARFWVRAFNQFGWGPYGAGRAVTVSVPPAVPSIINPPAPPATVTDTTPTYEWTVSPAATEYQLWVDGFGAPGVIQTFFTSAQANCNATTCTVTPSTTLNIGAAKTWVRARNSSGTSAWSVLRNFNVVDVNECALDTDNCDPAATCTNTPGSFTCTCPAGQIGNGTACSCDLSGTFAVREQLNVVWDPVVFGLFTILDGGSTTTSSWSIRQHNVSGGTLDVATTPCGATSPDICSSEFAEEAFSQFLPDAIWQGATMPVGISSMALSDPDPGEAFVGPLTAALGGISLTNPLGAWPPAHNSAGMTWIDHDNDTQPGMTQLMKNTGTSPTCQLPYANLFDPNNLFGPRIDRVYVGSRQLSNYTGSITNCDTITGTVAGPSNGFPQVNGHVKGCRHVGGAACSTATFETLDTQGQTVSQRITGSSFKMVRVSPSNITCAAVRAMSF